MGNLGSPSKEGILPITKSLQSHAPSRHFKFEESTRYGVGQWAFRGQGRSYLSCGTYKYIGCLGHVPKYIKRVRYSCGRAECPTCYKGWLVKATRKATRRVEAGRTSSRARPIHVTLSPPTSDHYSFRFKKSYLKMRRKAIRLAKKAGMYGGALIYHPYREIKHKELWYFSPHFHTIGYGWIHSAKVYHDTGWIVKNHRVRKSIGATIYYQLSHAGIKKGHHVVTWYGSLSWRMLKKIKEKAEPERCPICSSILEPVIYYGTGDNPFNDIKEGVNELYTESIEWGYAT